MFLQKNNTNKTSYTIYQKIAHFSRDKIFYTKYNIPDTIDGRFDVMVLVTVIIIYRLSKIKTVGLDLSQKIFDLIFKDLDYSLRELGAGDVSVTKNMRKFISSYMGRQKVYIEAFKKNNLSALNLIIENNVYRSIDIEKDLIFSLSKNILKIVEIIDLIENKKIVNGNFDFPKNIL